MPIIGKLLKRGIAIRESLEQVYATPLELQKTELRKLLVAAKDTQIGKMYSFKTILNGFKNQDKDLFYQYFVSNLPVYDYDSMYKLWWSQSRKGVKDVTWPGKLKYYALSSGTSGSSSKYIPITKDILKSMHKASLRQILTLSKYDIDSKYYQTDILMVGGSTDLHFNGLFFEGDLSGITTSQIPFWFQRFYKPGAKISKAKDWEEKLTEMVIHAKAWDVGVLVGVPAWIQILLERVLHHYDLKHIHEIWPNLKIFVHGGVSFKPYKEGFEKLLGDPIYYMETYLASEGFVAYQDKPNHHSMKLILNNGIFFEFVRFDEANFDQDGNIKGNPVTMKIDQVQTGVDYAILLTTNAGAWRYLIGDVVEFVDVDEVEIVIKGRTKHFLNLCGEHLSVDNMNEAINRTAKALNVEVKEFAVVGEPNDSLFAHHWYVGIDAAIDAGLFSQYLDEQLCLLNDDYKVERTAALKEVIVDVLPSTCFYDWMKKEGKTGGQHKFPRVLSSTKFNAWKEFLKTQKVSN